MWHYIWQYCYKNLGFVFMTVMLPLETMWSPNRTKYQFLHNVALTVLNNNFLKVVKSTKWISSFPLSPSSTVRHWPISSQPDGQHHFRSTGGRRDIWRPREDGWFWAPSWCRQALEDGRLGGGAGEEGRAAGQREKSPEAGNRETQTGNRQRHQ